jgi:hypothetical protein
MTVDQFEQALQEFGNTLESQLDRDLLFIGGELVQQLKTLAPVDSGDLQNSIQALVEENTLKIEMLYYGMFQNFGVSGANDSLGVTVPEGVLPRPTQGDTYKFGTRHTGLRPQTFFNVDQMADQIAQRMDELIQSRLNNI